MVRVPEFWIYVSTDRPDRMPRASASAERDARSASAERVDRGARTRGARARSLCLSRARRR